jgi:hypothetical protein
MIEVILLNKNVKQATAEADTPEQAQLAARTLWDDFIEYANCYGARHGLTLYFMVDGQLSIETDRRP